MKKISFLTIVLCIFLTQLTMSQNPKDFYKAGQISFEAKKYNEAITQLTKAIELKPQYSEALELRAKSYDALKMYKEALNDYSNLSAIFTSDMEYVYDHGRMLYELGNYEEAIMKMNRIISVKKKSMPAYEYKVLCLIAKGDYKPALNTCDEALLIKETDKLFYLHGLITYNLRSFSEAENDLASAVYMNDKYYSAYVLLAKTRLELKKYDVGIEDCIAAINADKSLPDAYIARSDLYKAKMEYSKAIDDLSQASMLAPTQMDIFLKRGILYQEFNQQQNAINDFSKVLLSNPSNHIALLKRAFSYEQIADFKSAIADYNAISKLRPGNNEEVLLALKSAKARLYELNRENVAPEIMVKEPGLRGTNGIEVAGNAKNILLKLKLNDASQIKYLKVEGMDQKIMDTVSQNWIVELPLNDKQQIVVEASDVYDNASKITYTIYRTETNSPELNITNYSISDKDEIFLDKNLSKMYFEGKVKDESLVKSIVINDVNASFVVSQVNPEFNATLDISNMNELNVKVTDIYGNQTIKTYKLDRSQIGLLEKNPMGKTWMVFISNSNYKSFASLVGPAKDVSLMRTALVNYDIHNFILKTDQTKSQLIDFFSVELRDLIKNNNVRSLIIWYAGHGKFQNNTGYWIPIDAMRDQETSYYSLNYLKGDLENYNNYVQHTLVISDACESGPSFYEAMRSELTERNCGDQNVVGQKSAQTFSSAGYELAADNSIFTRTFANALAYNDKSCIPIETIVKKVNDAVVKNSKQTPKFGAIKQMTNDGTFFFIRK